MSHLFLLFKVLKIQKNLISWVRGQSTKKKKKKNSAVRANVYFMNPIFLIRTFRRKADFHSDRVRTIFLRNLWNKSEKIIHFQQARGKLKSFEV